MGIKDNQIGAVAAASAEVQAELGGIGAAFWDNPTGKVALTYPVVPSMSALSANSGIIVAPTPSEWSMFPWRWEAVEMVVGSQLSVRLYTGFIVFSDIAGNPLVRFGTGAGDPGLQSGGTRTPAGAFESALANDDVHLGLGAASRPLSVLASGELVLWMMNGNGSLPAYVKGTFTVGPEIVLPESPGSAPPVP